MKKRTEKELLKLQALYKSSTKLSAKLIRNGLRLREIIRNCISIELGLKRNEIDMEIIEEMFSGEAPADGFIDGVSYGNAPLGVIDEDIFTMENCISYYTKKIKEE